MIPASLRFHIFAIPVGDAIQLQSPSRLGTGASGVTIGLTPPHLPKTEPGPAHGQYRSEYLPDFFGMADYGRTLRIRR